MPSSSIIIPVYNRASLTRQCLNALLEGTYRFGRPEIIVVDDASTDITPRLLADYRAAVTAIRLPENHGFAAACNAGAAAASGDYLVFLNNDTLPQPGWLDALIQYAETNPAAAAVGGKLLYLNDTIQHAGVVICQDHYPRHIYSGFPANHPAVSKSRRFAIVTAACVLLQRAPFFAAGGFDANFVNGYEDVDLCLRLGELGYEVHYCHDSVVYHFESATRALTGEQISRGLELYGQRWRARVQPDDVRYYLDDGLLTIDYPDLYPVSFQVSPYLATSQAAEPEHALERLLNYRTAQVGQLLREVTAQASRRPIVPATEAPGTPVPAGLAAASFSETQSPPDTHGQADLMHPNIETLVGSGDPWVIGQRYLDYFVEAAGLQPNEHVLDVGCGVGRMALPLARYLNTAGAYDGFDINPDSVAWCREKITPRYPNFHFQAADIFNSAYNPTGQQRAADYHFPFLDNTFDFVAVVSVFTHMLPDGVENYLAEIARVLKPGGRCLISLLLLDEENSRLVDEGRAMFTLPNRYGSYRTQVEAMPEAAVSYDAEYLRGQFRRHGLTLREPVRFGTWSGRQHDVNDAQDFVVVVKQAIVGDGVGAIVRSLEQEPIYPLESASVTAAVAAARASAKVLFAGIDHTLPGGPGHTRLSLLMPVKNGAARLERILGQVLRQRFPGQLEIIAVDSGSSDDSLAILKAAQATVIAIEPASFDHSQTRNLLASFAHGQFLIFLNQLAMPANEHWLASLVGPLEANPLLAGISSRMIPWPNADPLLYRDVVEELNGSPDRAILSFANWTEYEQLDPDARRRRLIFSTVSAAIRPEVLARFPFRPVRLIGEDIQWAKDVLTAGYQLQYEPASMVYHSHDYSLAEMFQRHVDDGAANRDIVGRRLPAETIGPAVLAQFEADQHYLKEALRLAGDELDTWQLEAFLRRMAQTMGQWVGSNYDGFDPALLRALSRVEHIRRGLSPGAPPPAVARSRPLPPPELLVRVIGSTDADVFERSGRDNADDFASALGTRGRRLTDFSAILDFGCGCGRVLRHLAKNVPAQRLSGSDVDPDAIRWMRIHYPMVDARTNGPLPPLSFADGTFDLVLSYSVFTHLDEHYQDVWLAELWRVTVPGARLLLTVHGNANWSQIAPTVPELRANADAMGDELRRTGFLHWRGDGWNEHFPDYYHTTWHTPDYIRRHWSRWFTLVDLLEARARPNQDIVILRRE